MIDDKSDKPTHFEILTIAGAAIIADARQSQPISEVLQAFQRLFNTWEETVSASDLWTRIFGIMMQYGYWKRQEIDRLTVLDVFNNLRRIACTRSFRADRQVEYQRGMELAIQPKTYAQGGFDADRNRGLAGGPEPGKNEEKDKGAGKNGENEKPLVMQQDEPLTDNDNVPMSPTELAQKHNVNQDALRKRLERLRLNDSKCFIEVADRGSKEAQYLYYRSAAMPIIRDMQRKSLKTSGKMSGKRPAKKTFP